MRLVPTRFSIRGLLLMAALVAVFLAWRLQSPESRVIAAISDAGGKVALGYQTEYLLEGHWKAFYCSKFATCTAMDPPVGAQVLQTVLVPL
ncbi:MAG: hypothetical protein U0930_22185 [Pirellulales bacterium]